MTKELQIQKKFFDTEILNAKTILINPKFPVQKKWKDKYHLNKVIIDEININIGDKIYASFNEYETYYKSNFIYKEDNLRIRINEFESNISSSYILPFIGIKKKEYLLMNLNFINCYVSHYNYKHDIGEYVYLIYRYSPISYYSKFTSILQKQKGCINYIRDERDKRFDCFIFKIDDKFVKDISLILKGKFSSISDESKKIILNFNNQLKPEDPINQILYKGTLRKNELEEYFGCEMPNNIDYAEIPNINKEIWNN